MGAASRAHLGLGHHAASGDGGDLASGGTHRPREERTPRHVFHSPFGSAGPCQAAAKVLGGMFRREQQSQDQSASGGASPSGPAPTSVPGALTEEMTVEVTSFSTEVLDDSLFASPAGYTQVQLHFDRAPGRE